MAFFARDAQDDNPAQQWKLHDLGGGQHVIRNVRADNCVLDYLNEAGNENVALFARPDNKDANRAQRWVFLNPETKDVVTDVTEGTYIIENARSGNVLDYAGDTIRLIGISDRANPAQQWELKKVASRSRTFVIVNIRRNSEGKPAALDYE